MQAIITKYIPPTNTKPENHRAACDALCARFHSEDVKRYGPETEGYWLKPKASGQIPSGEYVFCFIPARVLERNAK